MSFNRLPLALAAALAVATSSAHAGFDFLGSGSLSGAAHDLSGQSGLLENNVAGDLLGASARGWPGRAATPFWPFPTADPTP